MEKINKLVQTQPRKYQLLYFNKNNQSMNNSINNTNNISESSIIEKEKKMKSINSSLNINKNNRRKINPLKFHISRKIELRKPQLKAFHYLNNLNDNNDDKSNNDINKSSIDQSKRNSSILHLSVNLEENKNNSIISPKLRIPKKIKFKKSFFNVNNNIRNDIIKKEMSKRLKSSLLSFHDLGKNLLEKNKYVTDFMKNNLSQSTDKKMMEKKDWESVEENKDKKELEGDEEISNMENKDIRIEQLAKDLNIFQSDYHFKNINIRKNNSYSNLLNNLNISEENSFINGINKANNLKENISPNSRLSTRTPSSRIYSGKVINNFNNVNINKFNFDKNKIHDILNKRKPGIELPQEYEFYIEGTNILSPFCEKARDLFLYRKIFFYFGHKKIPKVMNRFLNNKLNLCYAENENQFNERIARENIIKKRTGKGKVLRVGKTDTEKRSESINHRVGFIKKVFDYAYPDILIYRIKHHSKMDKKEIRKNNFKNFLEKYEMDNIIKSKNILLKKKALLNSIKIEKV